MRAIFEAGIGVTCNDMTEQLPRTQPAGKRMPVDTLLSDEAIEWLVRLSSGRASDADHSAFVLWRQQSTDHEYAAQEAEALWQGIGIAGKQVRRAERKATITRRAMMGGTMMLAGGVVLERTGLIGSHLFADHVTGIGQQKTIELADGSSAFLNADTALSVDYRRESRLLQLFRGQATFRVARDAARPFIVEAGGGRTQAIGTAFDVRYQSRDVVVTVLSGVVNVSTDAAPLDMVRAEVDQSVHYTPSGRPSAPEAVDAYMETAWQRGKLIFNRRKLGDVVAEIERYRSGTIVITSEELRELEVTGAFDLNEPEAMLDTIENTLPVRITRLPLVTIIR